jgi:hypothetical protein
MIVNLGVTASDDVIEMWPGLGRTAVLALAAGPHSYLGVERGEAEATRARRQLHGPNRRCVVAPVHRTGLPDDSASVLYGEALLTLEPAPRKRETVAEAARLLRPGGRYCRRSRNSPGLTGFVRSHEFDDHLCSGHR